MEGCIVIILGLNKSTNIGTYIKIYNPFFLIFFFKKHVDWIIIMKYTQFNNNVLKFEQN